MSGRKGDDTGVKKIASLKRVAEDHEQKLREAQLKPESNDDSIRAWQREIEAFRKRIGALSRRLKREW